MVRSSASGEYAEECAINLKLGLLRLRPDVAAMVYGYRKQLNSAQETSIIRRPLDEQAMQKYGAPMLPEFCTKPLPKLKIAEYSDGWVYGELEGDMIGQRSAVDLAFGASTQRVPILIDPEGKKLFRTSVTFGTPAALLVSDFLVHRPSFGSVLPELSNPRSISEEDLKIGARKIQYLPMRDRVTLLGQGLEAVRSPDVPNSAALLEYSCKTLGWNVEEFDVFRARVEFPVLHSAVKLQFSI